MLPAMMTSLAFPERRVLRVDLYPRVTERDGGQQLMLMLKFLSRRMFSPLPDFITSARRELMLSAVFLVFLVGAIVACQDCWMILNVVGAPAC